MTTFSDDFERANGALGGNWVTTVGAPLITSGSVYATSNWGAVNTGCSDAHYQDVTVHVARGDFSGHRTGPLVCGSSGDYLGFYLSVDGTSAPYTLAIRDGGRYTGNVIASYSLNESLPPYYSLRLVWRDGYLDGYYEGRLLVQGDSGLYPGRTLCGFAGYYQAAALIDFLAVTSTALSLSVSPNVIGNYGSTTSLTFTGTGTAWTPGTPGSPTFTVNHGTLSNQVVVSATSATADYDPGSYLGAVTFTDPSTGQVAYAVVTSDPGIVPVGGIALSETAIAYIERSAAAQEDSYILNTTTPVGGVGEQAGAEIVLGDLRLAAYKNTYSIEGEASTARLLYILFGLLSGYHPPRDGVFDAPSDTTIKEDTDFLRERWEDSGHVSPWTLEQLRDALAGDPPASHQDILTALSGISVDNSDVLDAIAAMQGDPLATIKVVMDLVYLLDPTGTHNLAELLTAISDVRGTGAPTIKSVMDKLALIQTGNLPDLATIDQHISTMGAVVAAIDLVTAATGTTVGTTATVVDDIYDIVTGLQNAAPGGAGPLWPGVDNVTLGTELELVDGMEVTGPLNGLLISITGVPARYQEYLFGDVHSYSRVGAVVFCTDRGDYERSQTFSLDRQILIPATMEVAASAILRVNFGWSGTVRGWTRNA